MNNLRNLSWANVKQTRKIERMSDGMASLASVFQTHKLRKSENDFCFAWSNYHSNDEYYTSPGEKEYEWGEGSFASWLSFNADVIIPSGK